MDKQNFRRPRSAPPAAPKRERQPLKIVGDRELWVTLQRVEDPESGWTKTTRAMQTPAGVLINTCSRKKGKDLATEALCLVPGTRLVNATSGAGAKVVSQ